MPAFKKFTGNYPAVIDALGLLPLYYKKNGSKTEYDKAVAKDLPRTRYLNFNGDVPAMAQSLADTSQLKDEELSYSQGNFTGAVFTESRVRTLPIYMETSSKASKEGTTDNYTGSLGFTYIDDEGTACGFSITYLRDDSDQSIPVDERPRPFSVAIIKNVNKAPSEREVTYFTHPGFLEDATTGQDLAASGLAKEIDKAINCQSVSQLLSGVINKETIALKPFLELSGRLPFKGNIDDRDNKLDKLFDLFVMWAQLAGDKKQSPEKDKLMHELLTTINNAYQDVNYFKDKSMKNVEEIVSSYQKNPLISPLPPIKNAEVVKQSLKSIVQDYQVQVTAAKAQLNNDIEQYAAGHGTDSKEIKTKLEQSFMRRNLGNLLAIGFALLAVVSVALTLTGILAPVGLTIGAGLATALAVSGACAAGVVAAERAVKIATDEHSFKEGVVKGIVKTHAETIQQPLDSQYAEKLGKVVQSIADDEPIHAEEHEHIVEAHVGLSEEVEAPLSIDSPPPESTTASWRSRVKSLSATLSAAEPEITQSLSATRSVTDEPELDNDSPTVRFS